MCRISQLSKTCPSLVLAVAAVLTAGCGRKDSPGTAGKAPQQPPPPAEPVPLEMKEITYPLLKGPRGEVVVGATAKLGVYPEGASASKLREKLKALSEEQKTASPEHLIIHRFDALKEGRLDDALKYYLDRSRDAAAKRFGDVEAVKEFREKVTDVVFRARIRFGDTLYVKYKMVVPGEWLPTWMATLLRTKEGWRFFEPPEDTVLNTLAHGCPYWLPEQERTFSPGAGMTEVAVLSPTGAEPTAETVSRIYAALRRLGPEAKRLTDFFGKVAQAYRTGTDDEVVKLWKEEWREDVAVALKEAASGGDVKVSVTVRIAGETVPSRSEAPDDLRAFFRKHAAVEPVYIVDGEKTVYLHYRARGNRSPGGLRLLRLARTAPGGFALTRRGEDDSVAGGILASPFFVAALAKLQVDPGAGAP